MANIIEIRGTGLGLFGLIRAINLRKKIYQALNNQVFSSNARLKNECIVEILLSAARTPRDSVFEKLTYLKIMANDKKSRGIIVLALFKSGIKLLSLSSPDSEQGVYKLIS